MTASIILLSDLLQDKLQKERELEFYEQELRQLLVKMSYVRHEINLTETIIRLIQREEIPDILKNIRKYEADITPLFTEPQH